MLKLKPPAYHDCDEILALIRPVPAEEVFSVGIMNIARREIEMADPPAERKMEIKLQGSAEIIRGVADIA